MGTRRRGWITGEEEKGKGVGRALGEGDRESGQSVSRERMREKRNAMEILSGDEAEDISKKNTLRSVSPRSPCAPDVPGAYNINSCSGGVRPGSFRLEVKGPRPMRPDAQVSVRTHWMRPFLRPDAFDTPWCSHPPDTLPPAPSLFIVSLPMYPFPCCPFADVLRPRHLSSRPPPRIPPPASFLSMIPSLL